MSGSERFISREELYEMVWATPTQEIAAKYGLSDVALGKICRKLGVPKPPRGWWARKATGQSLMPAILPKRLASQNSGVYLTETPKVVTAQGELDSTVLALIDELSLTENKITVPEKLLRPHRHIRESRQLLRGSETDKYGILTGRYHKDCLNIRVSKRSLNRALLFLDTLFKSLESHSFEICITHKYGARTVARIRGIDLEITLFERSSRFEQVLTEKQRKELWLYDRFRFEPSGEFELILSRWPLNQRHWKDTSKRRIEEKLNDIVAEFVRSAELVRIEEEKREAERNRQIQLEIAAEEERQRQLIEQQKREELETQAIQWRRANDLRQFLDACEREFLSRGILLTPESPEACWLIWAREHADKVDPCTGNPILGSVGSSRQNN